MYKIPTLAEIEERLIAKGWNPRRVAGALAKAAGMDATTYRRWREGDTAPTLASWTKILKAAEKIENKGVRDGELLVKQQRRSIARARTFRRVVRKSDRGPARLHPKRRNRKARQTKGQNERQPQKHR